MSTPDGGTSSSEVLRSMLGSATRDDLRATIDRTRELVARLDAEQEQTPLTPAELATITEVTGEDDAPLGFRSLRAKVDAGTLTWDQVWHTPELHGPEAVQLVFAVLGRAARTTPTGAEVIGSVRPPGRAG